jgi:hypothetical protein
MNASSNAFRISGLCTLAVGGCAGMASAQQGTGALWWELSADNGQTWHPDELSVPYSQTSVVVRAMASWSVEAGYLFATTRFDGVWRSTDAGFQDVAMDLRNNPLLPGAFNRPIGPTRFGADLKLDDLRDTSPPGEGQFGMAVSQGPEGLGQPNDFSNPVFLFRYTVQLDGTPGERVATSLHLAPTDGNTVDRIMRIYTTVQGASNLPFGEVRNVRLRVLFCPADFNGDRQADLFDYLDFVQAFVDNDPACDFDRNAQVDFFDYLDFVAAFDPGC